MKFETKMNQDKNRSYLNQTHTNHASWWSRYEKHCVEEHAQTFSSYLFANLKQPNILSELLTIMSTKKKCVHMLGKCV